MADILSQDDLDALWTSNSNGEVKNDEPGDNSTPGISQGDLDALFADLGGPGENDAASEKSNPPSEGLSQSDLDSLWGGLTPAADGTRQTTATEVEPSGPTGESLSQDDIDRLLAEMGR